MTNAKNRGVKLKTLYAVFAVLAFGTFLIAINVYQLYHLSMNTMFKTSNRQWRRPIVWVYSKEVWIERPL